MEPFSLAFVCTGNRFRSPLAEAFVRQLTLGLPVTTQSFGTLELEGMRAQPEAVDIARSCGIDLAGHQTHCVVDASLVEVDLVLGFDESHVQQAVVDARAPRERSFTMRHFAQLLADVTPVDEPNVAERARNVVEQAVELRPTKPAPGTAADMPDPIGATWKVYRSTAEEIRELSLLLAATLFGVSDGSGVPPVPSKLRRAPALWRR